MPKRLTRRDVFALTSASLASPSLFAQQQENRPADAPDLVVLNARVITVNPRQPHAEAFPIKKSQKPSGRRAADAIAYTQLHA